VKVLSADWVVPVEGPPIRDGAVAIDDGRVAALAPASELGPGERYSDSVILPGFVNAHSHLEYTVYAGFGDGLPFPPWLRLHIERKRLIGADEMLAIARLGVVESLRSGITTTGDYSYSGAAATACAELGLRAVVYLEVFAQDPADARGQLESKEAQLGALDSVTIGVSPHAPYTCSTDVYSWALSLGVPVGTHLAESVAENEWLMRGEGEMAENSELLVAPTGTTAIRTLAEAGVLTSELLCAHVVHADLEELGLLRTHDVPVAHCPRSNALLGCGIAPLRELRERSVRVGLGTDSPASTPSFDMFEELRAAMMVARARERRPDALTAAQALELATIGAARALGLDDDVGSIAPGKQADLTVLSLAGSPFLPWEDPVTATVLGGSPERVVATLVSGEPRYEKGGKTWPELIAGAHSARSRLLSRVAATS
jgi:cytosine/adenosine deaminase-related metal-dependent hydrolase